jgi:hypothetical protein
LSVWAYFGGDEIDDDFEDEETCSVFFSPKGNLNPLKNNK